jgi:alpha-N-arabinofuranosidase
VNVLQAVILTKEEKMVLTPTYHVMEMYKVHQNAVMLPIALKTEKYINGNDTVDAVNASASRDKDGIIHISLVNVHSKNAQTVKIKLNGARYQNVSGTILQSTKLQDCNTFENPQLVKPNTFNGAKLLENELEVLLPAFSVVVLSVK